ncbi:hypothetical protein [Nannocystis punicea]|uniref:Uncharacterized protein n=1 Tax=Nannocystis punicea TaxID=2995304 RepID=A0ABY7GS22_9BACT|nr:hypothetical protein [Nannocystis poenicansa]WAS89737.1 hypothetical protein O0S08_26390 [Nannocystis poenicansa]
MAQDILIIVSIDRSLPAAQRVEMYCDPSILDGSSEGSNELAVKVPVGTELRWRVVPLQTTDPSDAGVYHANIESYYLWNDNGVDAGTYLTEWGTSNGGGDAPFYSSTGTLGNDVPASVGVEGIDRPFIQCLTQLSNRDERQSPRGRLHVQHRDLQERRPDRRVQLGSVRDRLPALMR